MNPYQVFVQNASFHHRSFMSTMVELIMRYESQSKRCPQQNLIAALIQSGIDKSKAEAILFEDLSSISSDDQFHVMAELISHWSSENPKAVEMACRFIEKHSPLNIDIAGTSQYHCSDNDGLKDFLMAVSSSGSVRLLDTLLTHNNIDLNLTDSNQATDKVVSVLQFLTHYQSFSVEKSTYSDYIKRIIQEPIDINSDPNKTTLYHLFLNADYAAILCEHGISLYDTSSSIYDRIEANTPNYAVAILRDIYYLADNPRINEHKAQLKKQSKKNHSLFYKPFFDLKLISKALIHFIANDTSDSKEQSLDEVNALLDSIHGEGWLWEGKATRIFSRLEDLRRLKATSLHDKVLSSTRLITLLGGVKRVDDVYLIAKHRNISPYDMLSETKNHRSLRIITEAISG